MQVVFVLLITVVPKQGVGVIVVPLNMCATEVETDGFQ